MSARQAAEIAIVGAGAAGLTAGIWAARGSPPGTRVVILDGARRLGAKILVAGGGRCNVTHDPIEETSYCGSSPPAIRKVLRRFPLEQTIRFFEELGVPLTREDSGKLFPVSQRAVRVLEGLVEGCRKAGAELLFPWRIESIERREGGFLLRSGGEPIEATRVILATGGKSLPKSGSDGEGFRIARCLGHQPTERIFPALVPLLLGPCPGGGEPRGQFLTRLAGVSAQVRLTVRSSSGKRLAEASGALLCTHFGISGPAVLDISRHWIAARFDDPGASLEVCWRPGERREEVDAALRALGGRSVLSALRESLPERLARGLLDEAGVDPATTGHRLTRDRRRSLVRALWEMPLAVTGSRGFSKAEVTAGGIPLAQLRLETMESRPCPGLYLCGEICDVDGKIGGYNFQWAWASAFVAGTAAGRASGGE